MKIIDDFKEDMKKMQGFTTQEKLEFIRQYYIWHIVVIVAVLVIAVSSIVSAVTKKDAVLNGIMLNVSNEGRLAAVTICEDFLRERGMDAKKVKVDLNSNMIYIPESKENIDSNYATLDVLAARITGKLLDFVAGNYNAMLVLAYSDYFIDLSQVMTEEQLNAYAGNLLYIDRAVLEAFKNAVDTEDYGADIKIPDPKKPELMETPVPVFLDVAGCEQIQAVYPNTTEKILFAVTANYPNSQNLISFIDFLLK